MKLVNFDAQFEKFAHDWMQKNAAKYKNDMDVMEAKMPEVYLQWLNKPADWLDGATPGGYFSRFDDAGELVEWMRSYFDAQMPVPDQLMERITDLGKEAEKALMDILNHSASSEDVRMTAISLLSEMESEAPMNHYISWISQQKPKDEGADMAAEALISMGRKVVEPILESISMATPAGKENFLDILCNFPGDDAILNLAIEMFKADAGKRALYSSYLGKLGDPRALPVLMEMIDAPDLTYLDYIEIRNAVEELGGEVSKEREFAGDPYYETMRRMQ